MSKFFMQQNLENIIIPKISFPARVAIVQASFYEEMGNTLLQYTKEGLAESEISDITVFSVPGSLEVPAIVSQLQSSGKYDGIIALGLVIKGGTNHYEIVTEESARGLMLCSLASSVPIINGILGAYSEEDIAARLIKGKSFAKGLVEMMEMVKKIQK